MQPICILLLLFAAPAIGAAGNKTTFPVPQGAERPGHVVLSPRIAEQDYFWIKSKYPSTPALEHYQKVFSSWLQCGAPDKGWDSYGDVSKGQSRYLHRFVRYWVSPTNDRAVIVLFQYRSTGAASRKSPDNDSQFVAVIQHRVPDAAAHFASIDVQCPQASNTTFQGTLRDKAAQRP